MKNKLPVPIDFTHLSYFFYKSINIPTFQRTVPWFQKGFWPPEAIEMVDLG
jgi:hypothetical protein